MKTLLTTLSFVLLLAGSAMAQANSPEAMIEDINKILCGDNPENVTTKYLGELATDDITKNNFNTQFRYLHDNYGDCEGLEIFEKTKYSESLLGYRCLFKFKIPVIFKFMFYKYDGKWKITYIYFSDKTAKQLGMDDD